MTLDEAIMDLQAQSVERGLGGNLADVDVALCEDGRHVSLWAFRNLDPPLMAYVTLPSPVSAADFDTSEMYALLRAELSVDRGRMN